MNLRHVKVMVAAVWVLALGAAGILTDVRPSFWLVLGACAIVPAIVMMRYWNHPDETTSQSIQQALR